MTGHNTVREGHAWVGGRLLEIRMISPREIYYYRVEVKYLTAPGSVVMYERCAQAQR